MQTEAENVIISAYVPLEVAEAIKARARAEDRSVSKVAGRILACEVEKAPAPAVNFATAKGRKNK